MINVQLLTAQGALDADRIAIYHAVSLDPNASSELGLEEMKNMSDELFEDLKSEIDPRFFS